MTTTKHTPGPWTVSEHSTADGDNMIAVSAGSRSIWQGYANSKENLANARLIAAAPDLLEALIDAQKSMLDTGYSPDSAIMLIIKNAINKARGE